MALRLVIPVVTLLALRIVHSASLPPLDPNSLDASELDAQVLDVSADGRKLDAVSDGEDEPIALLIGKDVKRVMRRKGLSDSNIKVSRRLEQHKDLESHLLESHEWSPRDSELERILDPVSLEDPKDIELKKAIAQLLKEVADREEKRKNKKQLDSNEGNSKESEDNVSHEDLNINTDHHGRKASQDYISDDGTTENNDKVDDHVDSVIDTIEHSDDTELRSSSIDADDDLKLNDEDIESAEIDYDDLEEKVSHEIKNTPKEQESLKYDDHHGEKYTDVQHNVDDDLEHKDINHSLNQHVSKETSEHKTDAENDNIDNDTSEQSIDSVSDDKSEESEHDGDSKKRTHHNHRNNHKHHGYKKSEHHHRFHPKQQNIDVEISHNDSNILKTEFLEDQSLQNHDDDIKTNQKDKEIHKDLQNESAYEDSLNGENHDGENKDDESDQIEENDDSIDSQLYSFENYDIPNEDSDENRELKDQGAQKTIDQSSKDDNDFKNHRRSYGDSRKETENDKSLNDIGSNLNPTKEAVKDDNQNYSIEILRHRLPRRYRSRKNDRISKSYRRASKKRTPIKQYTLSFFLRK